MASVNDQLETKKIINKSANVDEKNTDIEEISEIVEFYRGCYIIVTGASGFVGKVLVEKLLRSCQSLSKIYLLLRGKRGKSSKDRFTEYFEDVLFDRLKRECPGYESQVHLIEAGIDNEGFTLTPEDRELLRITSNVVFHCAASVRFDDPLRYAANINVRGTRDMFYLAREMPHLKAIVHVGTAYSNCVDKFIDEIFYDTPLGADSLLTVIDTLNDECLEHLTPKLIGQWPNTYAFTKTVAEDVVLKYGKDLPSCIVRPSIMVATADEPIPGWINNLYGPTGVVMGAGMGFLRTLHCNSECIADLIPADYVINTIIGAAWNVGTRRRINPVRSLPSLPSTEEKLKNEVKVKEEDNCDENPPIYNCVSSCQNATTWGEFMKYNSTYGISIPSMSVLWYYGLTLNRQYWLHVVYIYVFHYLPAVIIDFGLVLTGRKAMVLKIYQKIHKFMHVISYFSTQQWKFRNNNVMKLWNILNSKDKKTFYINIESLEWKEYYWSHIHGLRLFILKDPLDTIPMGKKRYVKLKILHYASMTVLTILFIFLIYLLGTSLVRLFSYLL